MRANREETPWKDACVVCGKAAWDDAHKASYDGTHPYSLGGRGVDTRKGSPPIPRSRLARQDDGL
jgi:hypothetical protein